ncbi:amino acid adenylation domain-containing protein [Streptomyces halstedii]|uniref:non-ribosomal peptide synthetase n=1 Tax=Streptomyces halstedii TaxID=1944 RepID=UPI0037F61285
MHPDDAPVDGLALSFAQQRLWFMDQLVPGNPFYNLPSAHRLIGRIDVRALDQALNGIVSRHEVLRTRFVSVAGVPQQVIDASAPVSLDVEDVSEAADPAAEALRLAREEALRPFDLSQSPLLRARLIKLGDERHVLLVTMHHIVTDAWSRGVFNGELGTLYGAFAAGDSPSLPPLEIHYADFAVWQRQWLSGEVLDEQLAYWRGRLAGMPAALEFPSDRSRPPVQSHLADSVAFEIPEEIVRGLRNLGRDRGATLFMVLLAAFDALLARSTGADDVVVGIPVAGRNRSELEGLIGFFVNSLVTRVDCSGDPAFDELLGRVREVSFGAFDHQDLPFERLVEELHPLRDLSRSPLVQVGFQLLQPQRTGLEPEGGTAWSLGLDGLEVSPFGGQGDTTRLDFELHCREAGDQVSGQLIYSVDLFDRATMERFADQFLRVLNQVVAAPSLRLSDLSLLTKDQTRQQLVEWNDTAADFPASSTVTELFEGQVSRTPDAVAVSFGCRSLTYGELNARANQVAHHLRDLGVGPEEFVGLCLERGVDLMVGMLGILKAGGAYLPLDPDHPSDRLSYTLDDAACRVVVTGKGIELPAPGVRTVCLDAEGEVLSARPTHNPHSGVTVDNVAYAIYTSGSTGRPKGVEVPHRGVTNVITYQSRAFGVTAQSKILQYSSICFDASVSEIWMAWITGAELVVAPPHLVGEDLATELAAREITQVALVPSVLGTLPDVSLPHLATILIGGEAGAPGIVNRWSPGRKLFNVFGPTEATVDATAFRCSGQVTKALPVGGPIANTQVYLLDARLRPVPVGIPGEVYIGGVGVARGYLCRRGLTASRFVANLFGDAGSRLYRSGDLGRYLPDGSIEFLSRLDDQVKLRGFRIELGEVESTLTQHPGVRQAAVAIREGDEGDRRLLAYVVPAELETRRSEGELGNDHVAGWRQTFDKIHRAPANLPGGTAPGPGEPASSSPQGHDRCRPVADRIRELRPSRVLEIGCGAGELLRSLAPYCERYIATDFSSAAVDALRFQPDVAALEGLSVMVREASDFTGFEPRSFDAVVLESVVQYFPGLSHLERVIAQAVEAVADDGVLVVTDIRNLLLLDALHASAALGGAERSTPVSELAREVRRALRDDDELALAPAYFTELAGRLPRVSRIEAVPGAGASADGLSRFRYDVVIHVGSRAGVVSPSAWFDWQADGFTLDKVGDLLAQDPPMVGFTRVPDAAVGRDTRIRKLLSSDTSGVTAGEFRDGVEMTPAPGVDLPELIRLAGNAGFSAVFGWSGGIGAEWDVSLVNDAAQTCSRVAFPPAKGENTEKANDPMGARRSQALADELLPALKEFARTRLPEYMLPSAFLLLDRVPLTSNGKLDQRALPLPGSLPASGGRAPSSPQEEALCALFAEVLERDSVGADESFFELGGHSLMAIRLLNRICSALGAEISLGKFFMEPTPAGLAEYLGHSNSPQPNGGSAS